MTPPIIANHRQLPSVTICLVVANLLLFGFTLTLDIRELTQLLRQWVILPVQLFTKFPSEFFTLLTANFLHGSWVHFTSNILAIAYFGRLVERLFRPKATTILYLVCALGANIAQLLIEPTNAVPIMGASGAIAGLMGASWVVTPNGDATGRPRRSTLFVACALWFIAQLFNGLLPLQQGIQFQVGSNAFFAVVAGLITGIWLAQQQLRRL